MLENGLVHKWKLMHWPKVQYCQKPKSAEPMTLQDIQGLLYIYIVLVLMAFIVLIAEIFFNKLSKPDKVAHVVAQT